MKKTSIRILSLSLGLTLAFSLTGCGGSASSAPSSSESSGTSAATPSASTQDTASMDYSAALDENGFWQGVHALDYVTLPDNFDNLTLPEDVLTVSEATIESQLASLPAQFSTTNQITDRAVAMGDTVNIDYVGSVDGVEFDGGSTNGNGTNVRAGSTDYVDDFLTQIIDHKPGETFNVEVTFPDDYGKADLQGKDAVFITTINYIEETITPEMNDEFVAENLSELYDDVKTVEELKAVLRDDQRNNQIYSYIGRSDGFMSLCTFSDELPQSVVDYQGQLCVNYYKDLAKRYNTDFSEFIGLYFDNVTTEEELLAAQEDSILNASRQALLFQAVAEATGINVSADEASAYIADMTGKDAANYESVYGMPYLKNYVMVNQVMERLADNAVKS